MLAGPRGARDPLHRRGGPRRADPDRVRPVPDLRARPVPVDPRGLPQAARLRLRAPPEPSPARSSATSEAAVPHRHCRDRLRRDPARRRLLPAASSTAGSCSRTSPPSGPTRPTKIVASCSSPRSASSSRSPTCRRRTRRRSPASRSSSACCLAGLELGAVEHDRRHRPDLHRRLPDRRSGQARRRVRRHHRDVAAGHAASARSRTRTSRSPTASRWEAP